MRVYMCMHVGVCVCTCVLCSLPLIPHILSTLKWGLIYSNIQEYTPPQKFKCKCYYTNHYDTAHVTTQLRVYKGSCLQSCVRGLPTSARSQRECHNIRDNFAVPILMNSNTVGHVRWPSLQVFPAEKWQQDDLYRNNILSMCSSEDAHQGALKQVKLPSAGTWSVKRGRVYL